MQISIEDLNQEMTNVREKTKEFSEKVQEIGGTIKDMIGDFGQMNQ